MADVLLKLLNEIKVDSWRQEVGFSVDMGPVLDMVLSTELSDELVIGHLNEWIARHQPCLFGRIAAKNNLISYCLLRENDLASDEIAERKIQDARLTWRRRAMAGEASGFIIVVLSRRLAVGIPNDSVKEIALRLGSLYLREKIAPDLAYVERVRLEQPGARKSIWEWPAGVNYFSAQGDKRWWQDHRFPAGIAFSVNSVGHMVRSGKLKRAMRDLEEIMGTASAEFKNPHVDSLEKALELAMRTIGLSTDAPSGHATSLVPRPSDCGHLPKCPIELPAVLEDKNYCEYLGSYHTDYTVPSEYFLETVERPSHLRVHNLDFTYLFDRSLDNFDFKRMGEGELISEHFITDEDDYRYNKRLRAVGARVQD
jgi:hypothetical protein